MLLAVLLMNNSRPDSKPAVVVKGDSPKRDELSTGTGPAHKREIIVDQADKPSIGSALPVRNFPDENTKAAAKKDPAPKKDSSVDPDDASNTNASNTVTKPQPAVNAPKTVVPEKKATGLEKKPAEPEKKPAEPKKESAKPKTGEKRRVSGAVLRSWTDKTGKFRIDAALEAVEDKTVRLKKADGKIVTVPVANLSEKDQAYLLSRKNRKKAVALVKEAAHMLSLNTRANDLFARDKLQEASRVDPTAIKADFILGLLNVFVVPHPPTAHAHFAECAKRSPDDASVLNNLAISEFKLQKFGLAVKHWERTLKLSPGAREVSQNLGRAARHVEHITNNKDHQRLLSETYTSIVAEGKLPASKVTAGWLYMPLFEKTGAAEAAEGGSKNGKPAADDNAKKRVAATGTGFVVHPGYVLTNRHVVDGADGVLIMDPNNSKKTLKAEVVGISRSADLALLRCESLKAPAVGLQVDPPRRSSDIMVLGYPEIGILGASLKSTRGSVTSLPNEATEGMILFDAAVSPGNSGGPIVDKAGNVVAVLTAAYNVRGRYSAGVPIAAAIPFIKGLVKDFKLKATGNSKQLEWPDVDQRVSKSTLLLLVQKKVVNTGLARRSKVNYLEDRSCPICNGTAVVKRGFKRQRCPYCGGRGRDPKIR